MEVFEISIPAFREEGDNFGQGTEKHLKISIPAFREEGDYLFQQH